MNIRMSEEAIRFRIDQSELLELKQKGEIVSEVFLPGNKIFRYSVVLDTEEVAPLNLCLKNEVLVLCLNAEALEEISVMPPTRDGVSVSQDMAVGKTLTCSLQVDVRKAKKVKDE